MKCTVLGRWAVLLASCWLCTLSTSARAQSSSDPLRVCVSSTDVRMLVGAVGVDGVQVTGFVKGTEDPHVIKPTRRMIENLASADLLVIVGNGLEEAWLPEMLRQVGKPELMPRGSRHLDLSKNLRTIVGPEGRGVRGSFHPEDNPHFLVDAVEGVKAAGAIAKKLGALRPQRAEQFAQAYRAFAREVMIEMLGESVASKHGPEDFEGIAIAIEHGEFDKHMAEHGAAKTPLGGQLAAFEPYRDTPVVGDHDLWPYLARRYGVRILGYLEPKPGVPPTAPHLQKLITKMKKQDARLILTVQYFDPRHARFVADATNGIVVAMANNPDSRPNTRSYLDLLRYNARVLTEALKEAKAAQPASTP